MENCYSYYYGLIFNCPAGCELDSCSYRRIRQFTSKERLAYYDALTIHEKKVLIERHQHCLSVREKKVPFSRIAIM